MIQDTSIKSFFEHQEQMNHDEAIVLREVRKEPGTIREIAVRLGWEAGRVSARLNALQEPTPSEKEAHKRKLGLVRIAHDKFGQLMKVKCKITGRLAYLWKATDPLPPAFPEKPKVESPLFEN